jgi:hypothetical protein
LLPVLYSPEEIIMATKKTRKRKLVLGECPNQSNDGKPYKLWEFLPLLKDKVFARFFLDLLKRAEENEQDAIACVNSYLEPSEQELQDLGIPASQWGSLRRCTDSGLLVVVTAKQNA